MANGDGRSKAPYIILCSGRTAALATNDPANKICYTSECAAAFMSHLEITRPGEVTDEEYEQVSELQHAMMGVVTTEKKREADEMCQHMFGLLNGIEQRLRIQDAEAQPATH